MITRRSTLAIAPLLSLSFARTASAQSYPDRVVRLVVPFTPGGATDVTARLFAADMTSLLRQSVVVDNRPGAAGAIALNAVAKAPASAPLLVTVPGPILSATPVPQIGKELAGVATLGRGPMVLVGTMAAPLPATLEALLAAARKDAKAFSFATSGNGTSQHLAGELINQMAETQMVHVPYKGGAQAVTDVVGGQVPLGILGVAPVLAHLRSGRLRAYGVTTAARSPLLPDVPTLAESGLKGFDADQWFVVATGANAPAERVSALNEAINRALQNPEVQTALAKAGIAPVPASPQQTTEAVGRDYARWQALVKKANLPLE